MTPRKGVMTIDDFNSKDLVSEEDAATTIRDNPFDTICSYIEEGLDMRVAALLGGFRLCTDNLDRDQVLRALQHALLPALAFMRWSTAAEAIRLAKVFQVEDDLKRIIRQRWPTITPASCHEFLLGLAGKIDVDTWLPELRILFELNDDNDVRTKIIKLAKSLGQAWDRSEARGLYRKLLHRMPDRMQDYDDGNNFFFIKDAKDRDDP